VGRHAERQALALVREAPRQVGRTAGGRSPKRGAGDRGKEDDPDDEDDAGEPSA
jgi:hypothetical protein